MCSIRSVTRFLQIRSITNFKIIHRCFKRLRLYDINRSEQIYSLRYMERFQLYFYTWKYFFSHTKVTFYLLWYRSTLIYYFYEQKFAEEANQFQTSSTEWLDIVWSLAVLGAAKSRHLESVLESAFVERLSGSYPLLNHIYDYDLLMILMFL